MPAFPRCAHPPLPSPTSPPFPRGPGAPHSSPPHPSSTSASPSTPPPSIGKGARTTVPTLATTNMHTAPLASGRYFARSMRHSSWGTATRRQRCACLHTQVRAGGPHTQACANRFHCRHTHRQPGALCVGRVCLWKGHGITQPPRFEWYASLPCVSSAFSLLSSVTVVAAQDQRW